MNNELKTRSQRKTLVLGATGKTGSKVLQRLTERGIPTRAGSRSANPGFDWMDSGTWKFALQNVDAVYITFQPDLAVPGAVEIIRAFVNTALDNGVSKFVLLSGRGEPEAQQCENIIMNAGADWTIVRASWFNQNFSEGYLLAPILAGHVALPAGNVGEPFVDTDDIADVVVESLTNSKHNRQVYEVTGPRLITFTEAMHEISKETGKNIQYEQISVQAYGSLLSQYAVPEAYISLLVYLFKEVLDGRNAKVENGIERALGRKPLDFRDYVKKTAATGIWRAEE